MRFTDRDGKIYEFHMYGTHSHIRSEKRLKEVIDRSTSQEGLRELHPSWTQAQIENIAEAYEKSSYHRIMQLFGMRFKSRLLKY